MTPALARACLEHLPLEEAALRALRDNLARTRAALLTGKADRDSLAREQADVFLAQQRVEAARRSLRSLALAAGLNPDQVRLGYLGEYLPEPEAAEIRAARGRLLALAAETHELARRVGTMLACSRAFTRRLLAEMHGGAVERYGPSGSPLPLAGGPR